MSTSSAIPREFTPTIAQYSGSNFVVGGGVAIFHIATGRVVICSAQGRRGTYHFLPKGRRDAGEESGPGAEREGYEEVRSFGPGADTPDANVAASLATATASYPYL